MTSCELCGTEVNSLTLVNIAGSTMKVCNKCKSSGKEVYSTSKAHTFRRRVKSNDIQEVVNNYVSEIQRGMNKRGVDVHQLARVINIKESSLNNYLKGKIKPAIGDARKIEKFLEIKLVEDVSSDTNTDDYMSEDESTQGTSLGDLIKKQLDKK